MSENSLNVSNVDSGGDGDNNGYNNKLLETLNRLKKGEELLFGSGDTKKFTKDIDIDEFYNQIKNLEIPNGLDSFSKIKDDLTEKINQIILGMHSFIEKHGLNEQSKNVVPEFLVKLDSFFGLLKYDVDVNMNKCVQLDKDVLKNLYQIFGKLENIIEDYQVKIKKIKSIEDSLISRKANFLYVCISDGKNNPESFTYALSEFFDIDFDLINDNWIASLHCLVSFINESKDEQIKKNATDKICQFVNIILSQRNPDSAYKIINNCDDIYDSSKQIDINIYNDVRLFYYFDDDLYLSEDNWIDARIKYIERQINVLNEKKLNDQRHSVFYTSKYEYKFFGIEPAEFFAGDDEEVKEFKRYLDYTKHIQNNLIFIWKSINKKFHEYNKLKQTNSKKFDQKLYERIKQDRANIYDLLCQVEAEKQKLLKEQLLSFREKKFGSMKLSGTEKFFRIILLILTLPIHAPIFIFVRTVIKFLNCFMMSFEIITKLKNGVLNEKEYGIFDFNNCKDDWANHCKEGYLDGIEINGKEICKRIRWWEKRWCRILRDIFFLINLAIFIVIGIVLAIKKLFKSIIKVFVITARIAKDIYYDDPSLYMFKTKQIIMPYGISETAVNFNGRISVLPKYDGSNVKLKNKFIDCTCPIVSYYDFAEKPKSAWEHLKCLIGIQSIKSVEYYNRYAHKNSSTPRLEYVYEGYVVMKRGK